MFRLFAILGCLAVAAFAQRTPPPAEESPANAAAAAPDTTALGALALLPKDVAARVARVEGPDGHPFPDRWYVLVHEPAFPTGLREFVICEGKAVANRALSQFADRITAEEVIGSAGVKLNSPEAAGIAAQFALHNSQLIGSIRYELLKMNGVVAWRLTCTGQNGSLLGTIVLNATTGTLLSHDGFAKSPVPVDTAEVAATERSADADEPEEEPQTSAAASTRKPRPVTTATKPKPKRRSQTVSRRSSQGPIDRVGSFFRKVFR